MSHTPEFRMSIDVTVHGTGEYGDPSGLIQEALREVTSRMDFCTKDQTGRVLDVSRDHQDKRVTVDITYVDARRPRGAT